jgi:opacity protein-like surface antigen
MKTLLRVITVLTLIVTFFLTVADVALAENDFSWRYGQTSTLSADVLAVYELDTRGGINIPKTAVTRKIDFDNGKALNFRYTRWFLNRFPVGVTVDASWFEISGPGVEIDFYSVSVLAMGRLPAQTYGFSQRAIEPYLGVGIGLSKSDVTVDFRPEMPRQVSGDSEDTHPELRLGLNWKFARHWLFGIEYRYFETEVSFKETDTEGVRHWFSSHPYKKMERQQAKVDIKMEQVTAGITFRF